MSDLSLLFATDPLELTTEQLDQIITEMRAARTRFNLGASVAAKPPRKPSTLKPDLSLSLKLDF